jgi:hypothetical protein
MAEDSYTIDLPAGNDVSSLTLYAEVLGDRGDPLSGAFMTFRLHGDGSLDDVATVHTLQRRTSKQGVSVTWYGHPGEDPRGSLKATLIASCPEALLVKLRPGTFLPISTPKVEAFGSTPYPLEVASPEVEESEILDVGAFPGDEPDSNIAARATDGNELSATHMMSPLKGETPHEVKGLESSVVEAAANPESKRDSQGLTQDDRSRLFASLSVGTAKHLGREPTVAEFIRLCDGVVLARKLAYIEENVLPHAAEIYWTGDDWVINWLEARDDRAA